MPVTLELPAPLQLNSVQVASYLRGGNSELKTKTRALVEQAHKGSWESYAQVIFRHITIREM